MQIRAIDLQTFPAARRQQQRQTNRNDFALCRVMARGQQRTSPSAVSRSLVRATAGEGERSPIIRFSRNDRDSGTLLRFC
ncbi:MAG: hypothetical protein MH252_05810 [Thermosynechococcaceae cyanobacterium MS004]|nr:hypothetical protein [Thermosynechococcaceae cyanobacterium MS004]